MPTKRAGRSGHRWRQAVAQLKQQAPPVCWLCGRDIDLTLHYHDPMAWQADHDPPLAVLLARGDDPDDVQHLKPAHRSCNIRKSNRVVGAPVIRSRRW